MATTRSDHPVYTIDQFLTILHPLQKHLHLVFLNFRRVNNRFQFTNLIPFYIAIIVMTVDMFCNIIKICLLINTSQLGEAQQVGAVFSIEILCLVRGYSALLSHRKIAAIANDFDEIFPRSSFLQQRMKLPKLSRDLMQRFRFLHHYDTAAVIAFVAIPCLKFLLYYEKGTPVADEYHQHASWLPFGIKENYRIYPFIYLYESYESVCGTFFLITWDQSFTVIMWQMKMHFDFLSTELVQLDPSVTQDPAKAKLFYKHIKECIVYHQHLKRLANDVNDIFDLAVLVSDVVSAVAICFHLYLILNTDDYMSIILFTFPCCVIIWLTFDICQKGTRMETVTSDLKDILYGTNWYDGSLEYRKFLVMWLQFANEPCKLTGFHLFEANMEHFQSIMTLAYQMLTFLQSR